MNLLLVFLISLKILIIGDSLSLYPGGYQTKVSDNVTNISKVGRSTSVMLKVLTANKTQIHKHKHVIIYGGINDIYGGANEDAVVKNIQKMVDIVNEEKSTAIVVLGYDPLKVQHNKSKALKYSHLQTSILNKIKGATIIVPVFYGIKSQHMSKDGIHLNAEGNRAFTKHVLDHLKTY
jgi:lysophospholipase L1-like esterase